MEQDDLKIKVDEINKRVKNLITFFIEKHFSYEFEVSDVDLVVFSKDETEHVGFNYCRICLLDDEGNPVRESAIYLRYEGDDNLKINTGMGGSYNLVGFNIDTIYMIHKCNLITTIYNFIDELYKGLTNIDFTPIFTYYQRNN